RVGSNRCGITSFVLTVAGFAFCATATGVAWRVWYVENDASIGSGTLVIGIWEVCFIQRKKLMGQNYGFPQCWPFTEEHTSLPKAMLIAQDLMIFVNLLDISTLGLMFFALWNVLKSKNAHAFLLTFFSVASTLNIISAILLLVPVVWNTHSILLAEEIRFPEEFNLPNSPNDQDIGTAIYLAYCAIFLKFLSGLLILWENSFQVQKGPVCPHLVEA
uniref:Claudin n=1 Tax=Salvator merianae TaxID=96440 RepID=A0A8D0BSI7_SALMN